MQELLKRRSIILRDAGIEDKAGTDPSTAALPVGVFWCNAPLLLKQVLVM